MNDLSTLPRQRTTLASVLLLFNSLVYLISEAVSAAAWSNPAYNYAVNAISDLGVATFGDTPGYPTGSPLYVVMNMAFIVHGVVFVAAAVLLAALFTRGIARAFIALATVHGIGIILVGAFPGSPDAIANGTVILHTLGAALAIFGGNIALIIASRGLRRRSNRALAVTLLVLGITGIVSVIAMFIFAFAFSGGVIVGVAVLERMSVYTIIGAELLTGVLLLRPARRD